MTSGDEYGLMAIPVSASPILWIPGVIVNDDERRRACACGDGRGMRAVEGERCSLPPRLSTSTTAAPLERGGAVLDDAMMTLEGTLAMRPNALKGVPTPAALLPLRPRLGSQA